MRRKIGLVGIRILLLYTQYRHQLTGAPVGACAACCFISPINQSNLKEFPCKHRPLIGAIRMRTRSVRERDGYSRELIWFGSLVRDSPKPLFIAANTHLPPHESAWCATCQTQPLTRLFFFFQIHFCAPRGAEPHVALREQIHAKLWTVV